MHNIFLCLEATCSYRKERTMRTRSCLHRSFVLLLTVENHMENTGQDKGDDRPEQRITTHFRRHELFPEDVSVKSMLIGNYKILNQRGKITAEEEVPSPQFIPSATISERLLNQASVGSSPSKETVTNLYNAHHQVFISELDWLRKIQESNISISDEDNFHMALDGAASSALPAGPPGALGDCWWTVSPLALLMRSSNPALQESYKKGVRHQANNQLNFEFLFATVPELCISQYVSISRACGDNVVIYH